MSRELWDYNNREVLTRDSTDESFRSASPGEVIRMIEVHQDRYESSDGYVMKREYGMTPNGNPLNGRWVLRDATGAAVGFDRYRNNLAEHYNLRLES